MTLFSKPKAQGLELPALTIFVNVRCSWPGTNPVLQRKLALPTVTCAGRTYAKRRVLHCSTVGSWPHSTILGRSQLQPDAGPGRGGPKGAKNDIYERWSARKIRMADWVLATRAGGFY